MSRALLPCSRRARRWPSSWQGLRPRPPAPARSSASRPAASAPSAPTLLAAGAREVDTQLRLWRLDARRAATLLPGLRDRGAVAFAQREQSYRVAATTETPDPLQADEWWLAQIGLEGQTAPGPGVPVTIVDSGLDFTHPEFAGRADTRAAQRAGACPARRRARHVGRVGDRRAAERRRPRRDLPQGRPALVGRGQGLGHAARVERDRRRHPRRGAGGQERHQPEPRRRHA